jgi:orotidine-5'-phosphate decarboxylase
VVAATAPELIEALRDLMPRAIFLLPGVGAQGGALEPLGPAFAPGRAAALVAASRSLTDPALAEGDGGASRSVAERLREQIWHLSA